MKKKQNKLPGYLTKVTLFSKLLAAILFIALPFLAFGLGVKYQQLLGDLGSQYRCPLYNHRTFINKSESDYQKSQNNFQNAQPQVEK